jgi:hypothetical protein
MLNTPHAGPKPYSIAVRRQTANPAADGAPTTF